ncbi:MAG: methionyl-tRNA formyltransferase [Gammaproteobacteria bacterium]|nr:MAG: methionyl-tRNA formyltransferase [Gammaproteobacteria bacterium]
MQNNLVFAGTPDFAAFHLQALIDSGHKPALVLTQPDRAAGRGRKLTPSPSKIVAENNAIPVFQPQKFDDDSKQYLAELPRPDLLIVVAYGLLLPPWVLDWAVHGAINVHASLLPRWRGAAPIQRAIAAGDTETGVAIMQMDSGLDTGDIWHEVRVPISGTTNAGQLHNTLQSVGAKALIETLPVIFSGQAKPKPQGKDGITYAKKLSKAEAQINWYENAANICRKIRAFNPVPIAHSQTSDGKRFRFYSAAPLHEQHKHTNGVVLREDKNGIIIACQDGGVCITELQEIGKKRLAVKDFLNGNSLSGCQFLSAHHAG